MSTPTQRSLDYLRKNGYIAGVVEQTIHFPDKQKPGKMTMFKRDLFNIFDIVCAGPGGIIGVQTTSRSNQQSRIQKIQGSREADKWLEAGGKIHVHGWALAGARGKRKLWEVSVHVMGRDEVASVEPEPEWKMPEGIHGAPFTPFEQTKQGREAAAKAAQDDSLFEQPTLDCDEEERF